jgi:hypothetical protein
MNVARWRPCKEELEEAVGFEPTEGFVPETAQRRTFPLPETIVAGENRKPRGKRCLGVERFAREGDPPCL